MTATGTSKERDELIKCDQNKDTSIFLLLLFFMLYFVSSQNKCIKLETEVWRRMICA